MTRDELRAAVIAALRRIAPEADAAALDPDADLRDALDIDSMDFLQLVTALDERLGVAVPEVDYARIRTLRGCVDYLAEKTGAP